MRKYPHSARVYFSPSAQKSAAPQRLVAIAGLLGLPSDFLSAAMSGSSSGPMPVLPILDEKIPPWMIDRLVDLLRECIDEVSFSKLLNALDKVVYEKTPEPTCQGQVIPKESACA